MSSAGKKERLILLTEEYPYKVSEEPFILPELRRLSKIYEITVIACGLKEEPKEIKCNLPAGIEADYYVVPRRGIVVSYYKHIKFPFSKAKKEETNPDISYFIKGMLVEKWFRQRAFVDRKEPFVLYSYWYMWWLLGFCENKVKYPNIKLITRTHNYDLFNERRKDNKQPFRPFMDRQLDRVLFVSNEGKQYYIDNMANRPICTEKYVTNYLGQEDSDKKELKQKRDEFLLVSCSYVKEIKRVHLIAQALESLNPERNLHWVHFGGGPLFEDLKKYTDNIQANDEKIRIELKGQVPNEQVLQFYNENFVDCFITTSSIEGLPVSISEAMSFGIPIIATKINGIVEQIEDNGLFLPPNPNAEEVAETLRTMMNFSSDRIDDMRSNSRQLWEKNFSADKCAEKLFREIAQI